MKPKYVYGYDPATGIFTGMQECQPNPLEWGNYLIPAYSVETEPPHQPEGKAAFWNGKKWILKAIN